MRHILIVFIIILLLIKLRDSLIRQAVVSSSSLARRVCGKIELEGTLFVGVFGVCTPATISLSFTPETVCSIPTRKVSVKSPGLFSTVP